jgi:hypothetical protein
MGYTHYWSGKRQGTVPWAEALANVDRLLRKPTVPLDDKSDDLAIDINGIGTMPWKERIWTREGQRTDTFRPIEIDLSHENLYVRRKATGRGSCKTGGTQGPNAKPYDVMVTAALCLLAEGGLAVTSDGSPCGWEEGRKVAEVSVGRPVGVPRGVARQENKVKDYLQKHLGECETCRLAWINAKPKRGVRRTKYQQLATPSVPFAPTVEVSP